jgi:hypothetical protein
MTKIKSTIFYLLLGALLLPGLAWAGEEEIIIAPPIVNLYNQQVSNNEIFYIGGAAVVPKATVIIYLQKDNGGIINRQTKTDESGQWFYSHSSFLSKGDYIVWTQLRVGDDLISPPSSKIEFEVSATALQLGQKRINLETLYAIFTAIFIIISVLLMAFIIYHARQHKIKNGALVQELILAEKMILHDFTELKKEIKARLASSVHKKEKQTQLLRDLNIVERRIEEELGKIGRLNI